MTATHGPWVDVHAHPGRCFFDTSAAEASFAEINDAGMAAVSFATVADLRVLGVDQNGAISAVREFEAGEADADHTRQLDGIVALAERIGARLVSRADDIEEAHRSGAAAILLSCEGADFAEGRLDRIADAHAAGARLITLVHYRPNAFGDIQTAPAVHGGLTDSGRELVREMNRLGLIVDLAHATFETTLAALEVSDDPVMVSHSHLAGDGRDHPRLVSADHAKAVASAGGLVGAWPAGVWCQTFDDFVEEIARLVDAIGIDHVAIGTDMDANFRPVMTTYVQFVALDEALAKRGFSAPERDRILGGNAVALIRSVCG